jgi:hypothetical protein
MPVRESETKSFRLARAIGCHRWSSAFECTRRQGRRGVTRRESNNRSSLGVVIMAVDQDLLVIGSCHILDSYASHGVMLYEQTFAIVRKIAQTW